MSGLVLLVLGMIIAIISSTISFLEKRKENKIGSKRNNYNLFTFIAILIGITIAFYSGYTSINDKIESDKKKEISDSLARKSQHELQQKSDMIIQIQNENKQETKSLNDSLSLAKSKIINLQNEINNNIVGSLEPSFIVFQTASDKKGYTVIVNEGKKSILGLDIYITDFNEMMKCKQSIRNEGVVIDEPCYKNCTQILNSPIVRPGPNNIPQFSLPDTKDEFMFEIRFLYDRNVEYLEQLICRRKGNDIKCFARLLIAKNNKYEFLKIINPSNVDWEVDFDKLFNLPLIQRAYAPIYWR